MLEFVLTILFTNLSGVTRMSDYFDPIPSEESKQEKKPGCLFRAVAGFVILTLLASSLYSIAWFVKQQEESQAAITVQPTPRIITEEEETTEAITATPPPPETAPTPTAPVTALINRIAMVNNEGQIETVAPDGSERRILTSEEYNFQNPAWSPDGRQIAVLGNNNIGSGIFLLEDSPEPSAVNELLFGTASYPFYLYWSPDSSKISYLASRFGRQMNLNIIDALEGAESRIIASGSPFYWDWTADSDQLLIHSGTFGEDARLALIDNRGNDQTPEISNPGYFQAPGISPSGRYWAYSQLQEGDNSWLTIDDRQSDTAQTERHAGLLALGWSPAADKLAFISGEAGRSPSFWGPLRLIDASTGEMRVLSSNLVLAFFWSPDGKKIAAISVPFNFGLDSGIEVNAPKSRQLAKSSPPALQPVQQTPHMFSVSVIDVEKGTGLELGEFSFSNIFLTQFLIFFDQYALSHSIWSPNSDALVLPVLENGETELMVIAADSGRMSSIGQGPIAFWSRN
jgi:TolB protein